MTWKDYVEPADFSNDMHATIIRAIGFSKFIALTTMLAKMYVYLKKLPQEQLSGPLDELPEDYQLCIAAIGRESTHQLAEAIGQTYIHFTAPETLFLPAKRRFIDAHFNGKNHRLLAMKTRLSLHFVYKHLKQSKRIKSGEGV